LFPQPIIVLLKQENSNVTVWRNQGVGFQELTDQIGDENDDEEWWHQVQHIINEADGKKVVVKYLLPNDEALVRKIALPVAAKENLDEVIGFELDKYVPFSADQVQISYKINNDIVDENKLLLDLAVITKQKLLSVLNTCEEKSIALDSIDVNTDGTDLAPSFLGVNLLPNENRKQNNNFNLKLNGALVLVLIGLIYFIMHTSIENKRQKIEKLSETNAELQKQARESKLLKKDLKDAIVSSKFLQNQKINHPKIVTLIMDITTKLPDTTYLTKLKIDQEELEISGLSDNANILVPELDKSSNWYAPLLKGPTTPDPRSNKERFTIIADMKEQQEEETDGQS
jgi:general secretion pathway protein L